MRSSSSINLFNPPICSGEGKPGPRRSVHPTTCSCAQLQINHRTFRYEPRDNSTSQAPICTTPAASPDLLQNCQRGHYENGGDKGFSGRIAKWPVSLIRRTREYSVHRFRQETLRLSHGEEEISRTPQTPADSASFGRIGTSSNFARKKWRSFSLRTLDRPSLNITGLIRTLDRTSPHVRGRHPFHPNRESPRLYWDLSFSETLYGSSLQREIARFGVNSGNLLEHLSCLFSITWMLAESGGFEPPIELSPYNGLANRRLQPLGQLSCGVDLDYS
jgi:hypothetical protein